MTLPAQNRRSLVVQAPKEISHNVTLGRYIMAFRRNVSLKYWSGLKPIKYMPGGSPGRSLAPLPAFFTVFIILSVLVILAAANTPARHSLRQRSCARQEHKCKPTVRHWRRSAPGDDQYVCPRCFKAVEPDSNICPDCGVEYWSPILLDETSLEKKRKDIPEEEHEEEEMEPPEMEEIRPRRRVR